MKKLFAFGAVLLAFTGTAVADDLDEDGFDDVTGEAVMAAEPASGGTSASSSAAASGGGDAKKMAIIVSFNGVGDLPILHGLYNIGGENYLDFFAGFGIENFAPDTGDGATIVELTLGGGYRMYKPMDGRVHPYLEPYLVFNMVNDGGTTGGGDNPDPIRIGAGAMLGVDVEVVPQFTLGAAFGAGLDYEIISDFGNTFTLGVYTTALNATIWWG